MVTIIKGRGQALALITALVLIAFSVVTLIGNSRYLRNAVERRAKNKKDAKEATEEKGYNLVWLMSYPFSGSSVALNIAQEHSGYSMATNYGNVMQYQHLSVFRPNFFDSEPIDKKSPNGPFKYRYDRPLPPDGSDILVKTHCSGFCIDTGGHDCKLRDYTIPLVETEQFFSACRTGTSYSSLMPQRWLRKRMVKYNAYRVKKVVLLVRNPFDIIVARFLNAVESDPSKFEYVNHHGLRKWCAQQDAQSGSKVLKRDWYLEKAKPYSNVPCHAEFYRISMWYERALDVIEFLEAKMLQVHFEDYELDYGKNSQSLLQFLQYSNKLERGASAYAKYGGRRHAYFTNEEYMDATNFIKNQVSKNTTMLFERYF